MRLAAVEVVPERYAALASGVFSTSRYFGGKLGSIAIRDLHSGGASGPPTIRLRAALLAVHAAAFACRDPSLALPGQGVPHDEPIAEEVGLSREAPHDAGGAVDPRAARRRRGVDSAMDVPTTAGMPNCAPTTAACESDPPTFCDDRFGPRS